MTSDNRSSLALVRDAYLSASPSWQDTMPPGITRVVQGESDLLGTLTPTQVIGGEMSPI
jgi:hypothetical protein